MNRRAYTLIELLIVVAIVAIMVSATFSMVFLPMREAKRVDLETSSVVSFSAAYPALVADAHASPTALRTASGIRFLAARGPVEWSLGEDAVLRRRERDDAAVAIADRVQRFEATIAEDRVSISIAFAASIDPLPPRDPMRPQRQLEWPVTHERTITLALANGARP